MRFLRDWLMNLSRDAVAPTRDWETLSAEFSSFGCTVIAQLLTPEECRQIARLYPQEGHFRLPLFYHSAMP
jgi:hypothetical protein